MQALIEPIDPLRLESELSPEFLLRETGKGDNLLYVVDAQKAPSCLREIGRLRELSFREGGGGTGLDCDLDPYDTEPNGYEQMLLWDPESKQIAAAYRFVECRKTGPREDRSYRLSSASLFEFSSTFKEQVLPHTIELGRAFVAPDYQPGGRYRKGIFALDNLWDGLGALTVVRRDIRYLYGKVTLFEDYPPEARTLLHTFMQHFFTDPEGWVKPQAAFALLHDKEEEYSPIWTNKEYASALPILTKRSQELGAKLPPLFPAYMNLSTSMKYFGFAHNKGFGRVDEAGILVTVADINQAKTERHILSYRPPSHPVLSSHSVLSSKTEY